MELPDGRGAGGPEGGRTKGAQKRRSYEQVIGSPILGDSEVDN